MNDNSPKVNLVGNVPANIELAIANLNRIPASKADIIKAVRAASPIPDMGDAMNAWVERVTLNGNGKFAVNDKFPNELSTDPAEAISKVVTMATRSNWFGSNAFLSNTGSFSTTIGRPAGADLIMAGLAIKFSADTLNVSSQVQVDIEVDIVSPDNAGIAIATLSSYWRGLVITGDGDVPQLEFYPWVRRVNLPNFGATGTPNELQPLEYHPAFLPAQQSVNPALVIVDNNARVGEVVEIRIALSTSNPNVRTDMQIINTTGEEMDRFTSELLAYKLRELVDPSVMGASSSLDLTPVGGTQAVLRPRN